jgi:hypothetical protein
MMLADVLNPTGFRYERKFVVSHLSRHEIESIVKLHPAMFSEVHHQRFVNNIYFDTVNGSSYFDSADGIGERLKVRVRWYGDLLGYIGEPVLELKMKRGLLGSKARFPLDPFHLADTCTVQTQQMFESAELPSALLERLRAFRCSLLNRYSRRYFESANRRFRLTIDVDMEFIRVDPGGCLFVQRVIDRDNTIVELKYASEDDERARFVASRFPFRMTKSSKYVSGLQRLNT